MVAADPQKLAGVVVACEDGGPRLVAPACGVVVAVLGLAVLAWCASPVLGACVAWASLLADGHVFGAPFVSGAEAQFDEGAHPLGGAGRRRTAARPFSAKDDGTRRLPTFTRASASSGSRAAVSTSAGSGRPWSGRVPAGRGLPAAAACSGYARWSRCLPCGPVAQPEFGPRSTPRSSSPWRRRCSSGVIANGFAR